MSKKNNTEMHLIYGAKIISQIIAMFNEECENYIDKNELLVNNNATEFIYALACLAPCDIYHRLTGEGKNVLEFNHIANQMVFDFAQKEEE